ncbi:flavonoid 3'-monooxygenase CYP75B137-like protein [Salvia divinorum]|uniref:Flavonoid 3'-monooxygenase CYP75B137-like protein n=1 Tax=Salvia divinorum TaxID=28513 RepID=A0ABD1GTP0_SALDI
MQIVTNLTLSDQIFNSRVLLYAIPILTVIWYSWLLSQNHHRQPLPPGPRGLPIVGSLPFLDPELHSHFAHLAASYGPIFSLKLGRTLSVVITSPAAAREVLKHHDVAFANRPVPAVVMSADYGGREIVFTPHGPEWRMLRKACVRDMLGHATLDAFYGYRRHEVRSIVSHLYSLKGAPVNVGEMMISRVLNVITTWMDLQGLSKKYKKVSMKLEVLFDKIIEEEMMRRRTNINGGDLGKASNFLQVLLRLKEGGDTEIPLTMMHIKALLTDMVVGGTDTTSSTVEFAMAEMMKKPEVMQKAQREVDAVVGKNRAVEESDTNKLPYLNAVMKEVLRLHLALPLMVPHCPSKPCIVAGYTVPKGARTFVNVWAIHRDPKNWTNPNEFIPERFLNGEGDFTLVMTSVTCLSGQVGEVSLEWQWRRGLLCML